MKRIVRVFFPFVMIGILTACGNSVLSEREQRITMQEEVEQSNELQEETQSEGGQNIVTQETEEQSNGQQGMTQEVEVEESENHYLDEREADVKPKILVTYFSCTGTTRSAAEYTAEILGADLYEIVPENPYTETDLAYYTNGRADQEQNDPDARPAISGNVENMKEYNIIILGYPIWHGQAPRIISTFLESYDFSEKTMIPFCTSHSSGIGSSADDLHDLCSESVEWMDGKRFGTGVSRADVEEWIGETGMEPEGAFPQENAEHKFMELDSNREN